MREGRTLPGSASSRTPIAAIVPTYLWRFRKTGQFRGRRGVTRQPPRSIQPDSARPIRPSVPTIDAPPGEQRKAVARHVVEQRLHHDPAGDERRDEADRDDGWCCCRPSATSSCRDRARTRPPWWASRERTRTPPPSACRRRAAWPTRWSRPSATRRGSWRGTGRGRCRDTSAARTPSRRGSAA